VFVIGANAFPQNAGYNPTDTVGALTYWALDAIKNRCRPALARARFSWNRFQANAPGRFR